MGGDIISLLGKILEGVHRQTARPSHKPPLLFFQNRESRLEIKGEMKLLAAWIMISGGIS
jgi:hypothetical protein